MKNKLVIIQVAVFSLVIIFTGIVLFWHISNSKIGYVDSTKLVSSYQGMIDARGEYKQKSTIWQSNIDTLAVDVKKTIQEFEQQQGGMSEREKKVTLELIRTKRNQLGDYQKALSEKANQEDAHMTTKVLSEINAYIKKYGDQHGYKIIFVATQYGNIAYADEGIEITDIILEGLNKKYNGN